MQNETRGPLFQDWGTYARGGVVVHRELSIVFSLASVSFHVLWSFLFAGYVVAFFWV